MWRVVTGLINFRRRNPKHHAGLVFLATFPVTWGGTIFTREFGMGYNNSGIPDSP